eukprot:7391888-Prymnesium_polylepis.3
MAGGSLPAPEDQRQTTQQQRPRAPGGSVEVAAAMRRAPAERAARIGEATVPRSSWRGRARRRRHNWPPAPASRWDPERGHVGGPPRLCSAGPDAQTCSERRRRRVGIVVNQHSVRLLDHQQVGSHAKAKDDQNAAPESAAVRELEGKAVLVRSELLEAGWEEVGALPATKGGDQANVQARMHPSHLRLSQVNREGSPPPMLQRRPQGPRELEANQISGGDVLASQEALDLCDGAKRPLEAGPFQVSTPASSDQGVQRLNASGVCGQLRWCQSLHPQRCRP